LSRVYLETALEKGWIKTLTFTGFASGLLKPTHIDFVKKGRTSRVVYLVLAVLSIVLLFWPGMRKGIDFTGGRNYIVNFVDVQTVQTEPLTKALQSRFGDATVSVITINASNENEVRISTNYALNSTKAEDDENIKHMIYDAGVECNYIPASVSFDAFNNETYIPSTQKVGHRVAHRHRALHLVPLPRHRVLNRLYLRFGSQHPLHLGSVCHPLDHHAFLNGD
jgi:SecD/SecF fusion protein